MKVRGYVEETIIVVKEIDIEVPDDAKDDAIHTAVRDKCYEKTILDYQDQHGWEGVECTDVNVRWVKYVNCHVCGNEILEDDQCSECGTMPPCCAP